MAKKTVQTTAETFTTIGSLPAMPPAKGPRAKKQAARSHSASPLKAAFHLSKSDQVLALLKRTGGATLDDLMKATRWQSHSVRGFLSGAVRKRMGLHGYKTP